MGAIRGVKVTDRKSCKHCQFHAHVIINATGIFSDHLRQIDNQEEEPIIHFNQGIHWYYRKNSYLGKVRF